MLQHLHLCFSPAHSAFWSHLRSKTSYPHHENQNWGQGCVFYRSKYSQLHQFSVKTDASSHWLLRTQPPQNEWVDLMTPRKWASFRGVYSLALPPFCLRNTHSWLSFDYCQRQQIAFICSLFSFHFLYLIITISFTVTLPPSWEGRTKAVIILHHDSFALG